MLALLPLAACPSSPDRSQAAVDIDLQRFVVELAADDYAIGGDDPLVTIVLWTDYACGPCGRSWKVMEHLVEDFGKDLRVVFRAGTVPGFQHGERAAEAAFAAGDQGQFWAMHWRLFDHPEDFSRPVLREHAEALGLDVNRFLDDLDTGRFSVRRIRDRRQAAELGVRPLPAAFVNGLFVLGFKDEASWHALVEREITTARQLLRDGTKRGDLYGELMRTAKRGSVGDNDEAKRLRAEREATAAAREPSKLVAPDGAKRYAVPSGAPGVGPADAPVVVVEFLDYECPYCRRAHTQIIPQLRERYGADLRIEVRHLPLEIHPAAAAAARAAITAGEQGKFAEYHEALLAPGADGKPRSLGFASFQAIARELGLDVEQFERDFQTREVGDKLLADVLLARRLGVSGTPGFFINGRFVDGARSLDTYTVLIEDELARARKLAGEGTARADLHAALMQGALGPEAFPNAHLRVAPDTAGAAAQDRADQESKP